MLGQRGIPPMAYDPALDIAGGTPVRPSTVVVFVHVGLLMVLGYGYQQIRVVPPQGIPLSELLLAYLLVMSRPLPVLAKLHTVLPVPLFLGWVTYGSILVLTDVPTNGYRALRDGSPVIETLFLYVGFVVAGRPGALASMAKWMPWLLGLGFAYAMLEQWDEALLPLSPILPGAQGQPVPVLFTFSNLPVLLAALVAFSFATTARYTWHAVGAVALVVMLSIYASRTVLLIVLALVVYWGARGLSSGSVRFVSMLVLAAVLFFLAQAVGIDSRNHGILDSGDYVRLVSETFTTRDSGDLVSSGSELRIYWWLNLFEEITSSLQTLLFGLGYGMPLTDGVARDGTSIYEPHNVLVSVLSRAGLVGVTLFVWLQAAIVWQSLRVASWTRGDPVYGRFTAAALFIVLGTLIYGIGQTPFVMPSYAVPYYFFAGVILRMAYNVRRSGVVIANERNDL